MSGEFYLGDGLYATDSGYDIKLRAPRGDGFDHEVYLDDHVLKAFLDWLTTVRNLSWKAGKKNEGCDTLSS